MLEFCDWRRDSDVNIANRLDFRPALARLAPISVNGIEITAMHKHGVLLPECTLTTIARTTTEIAWNEIGCGSCGADSLPSTFCSTLTQPGVLHVSSPSSVGEGGLKCSLGQFEVPNVGKRVLWEGM